ncbi:DegV family protein [Mycolicibacterium sp. CH28]|uniref:DegV family protein n=1 Tax=Mycolicibacterium sp. CH28 TaxID=2512237 RepID=UPI00108105DF|nr:DegV family protein [Mycolicibacterium sp. CH28]TGD90656.1 DegV family protein [Mycolicibacterium sp. CH28]
MAVVVVTDSSARLPADEVRVCGIRVVPLHILIEGRDLRDGVDAVPADLYQRGHVTTAGATPSELSAVYRQALHDSGTDGVVAVHISGELSSTLGAAEYAAREFGGAVRVVDSKSTAMGTGFVALAAARAAQAGAGLDAVVAEAESAAARIHAYIVVHRLDNLRRSGRIGTAASWLGTALALKPLLRIDEQGRLVLAQRVRTASKAVAAMVEQVLDVVGERRAALAVHHIDNPVAAAELAATLASALPGCGPAIVTDLGPVLGVHVGAGAVGVVVAVDPTAPPAVSPA